MVAANQLGMIRGKKVVYEKLVESLMSKGHSEAAAQWAIHEMHMEGTLKLEYAPKFPGVLEKCIVEYV